MIVSEVSDLLLFDLLVMYRVFFGQSVKLMLFIICCVLNWIDRCLIESSGVGNRIVDIMFLIKYVVGKIE